jgi:hypothetical protein
MVIPVMDTINDEFNAVMQEMKRKWHPSIYAAVGLAKKTLNKYYSLTDNSKNYWITISKYFRPSEMYVSSQPVTVLHPQIKLKYFKDQKWKPEWISCARTIFTERFHESYAGRFGFQNSRASGWESGSSHASSEVCSFPLFTI